MKRFPQPLTNPFLSQDSVFESDQHATLSEGYISLMASYEDITAVLINTSRPLWTYVKNTGDLRVLYWLRPTRNPPGCLSLPSFSNIDAVANISSATTQPAYVAALLSEGRYIC